MARLLFPDAASIDRVQATAGTPLLSASGAIARVYLDAAGTQLADIMNADLTANVLSALVLDNQSRLPAFYGPTSGVGELFVRVDGGSPVPVGATLTDRLADQTLALAEQLTDLTAVFEDTYLSKGSAVASLPGLTAVQGRNLYNPNDADVKLGFLLSSGVPVANAIYTTTGFIPVTAGLPYTLSNARSYAFYNSGKTFINQPAKADSATITVTPAQTGFLRASFLTGLYTPTFQVEQAAAATAYVPYTNYVPHLQAEYLTGTALAQATTAVVGAERVGFATVSPNLLDPASYTSETVIRFTAPIGALITFPRYTTSGFIPVVPGRTYTHNTRHVAFYTQAQAYLSTLADNPTHASVTITAPLGAYFVRVDFDTDLLSDRQFEVGGTATTYQPFGVTLPTLAQPMTVSRVANDITVYSALGSTLLTQTMTLARPDYNLGFNLTSTLFGGALLHGSLDPGGDDVTPVRTQLGTLGGNHGFANYVASFANPDAKTTADLGSVWTDGVREYVLLGFDGSRLFIGGSYTVDGQGVVQAASVNPVANLTHVSGATKTGTIISSTKTFGQMFPSVGRMQVRPFMDGKPLANLSAVRGRELSIHESYEVLDYRGVYDTAKANIGVSYATKTDLIAGCLRMTNVFRFTGGGRVLLTTSLTSLLPTALEEWGVMQQQPLSLPGAVTLRYIPGLKPIGGFNFAAGFDLAGYSTDLVATTADLLDPTVPPILSIDRLTVGGVTAVGFAFGFFPYQQGAASMPSRLANAPTELWDMRGTGKSYPVVTQGELFTPGERMEVEGYRVYLTADQLDPVVNTKDALQAWTTLASTAGLA